VFYPTWFPRSLAFSNILKWAIWTFEFINNAFNLRDLLLVFWSTKNVSNTLNFAVFIEHQKRVKLHQVGVNLKFTLGKCKLTIRECIFTPRLGYANTVSV
jgi:hypothetical protein